MDYEKQYQEYLVRVNRALDAACEKFLPEESEVCRAARYSLLGGGKRIRAVLVLAVCDMLDGNAEAAEQFAAAVEMLHCYSLIHDDLPCMDNDDLRRGKPSCHKAFGESTAMLAGDVLLTEAFNVIANASASPEICVRAAKALGAGAGSHGMVYGQELDLKYEALAATEEQLRLIHRHKTGALINAPSRWAQQRRRRPRRRAKSWKLMLTASASCFRSSMMCWMWSARRSSSASPSAVTAKTARRLSSPCSVRTAQWSWQRN